MNDSYSDAIKEAYTLAPSDVADLETLQFSHPALPGGDIFIVRNLEDLTLTLENGTQQLFKACGFTMSLPPAGDDGVQQLPITIDLLGSDDDGQNGVMDFINAIKQDTRKCIVTYRPYLSTDYTTPQMNPPLQLCLQDITILDGQAQGNCTFLDVVNMPFPYDFYTRQRFPGLGN